MKQKFQSLIDKHQVAGEVYSLAANVQDFNFKNGKFSGIKDKYFKGLSVRVIKDDGRVGFSYAANDDLESAFLKALEVAPYTSPVPLEFLADTEPVRKTILSPHLKKEPDFWIDLGGKIVKKLEDKIEDASVNCSLTLARLQVGILNSRGMDKEFLLEEAYVSMSLAGAYGDNIVNEYISRGVRNRDFDIDFLVEKLTSDFLLAKKTVPFDPGKYPVIFAPTVMSSVLKSLESGLSGYSVYKKLSPLTGKLGERILSPKFSLQEYYDDDEVVGTIPFDDEGTPTKTSYVIEKGVLKRYLLDLEYAKRLNLEPTGNAFRSSLMGGRDYKIGASMGFGNVRITGGDVREEDLISGVKEGVYLKGSFDCWMGNILPGTLRGSLHLAYKIENGKLVGRIKNRMFSGNFYNLFGDQLEALSSEVREALLAPGFYAPAILVKDVDIV